MCDTHALQQGRHVYAPLPRIPVYGTTCQDSKPLALMSPRASRFKGAATTRLVIPSLPPTSLSSATTLQDCPPSPSAMVLLDEAPTHKALAAKRPAAVRRYGKQSLLLSRNQVALRPLPSSTFTFKATPTSPKCAPKSPTCPSLLKSQPKATLESPNQPASRIRTVALGPHCVGDVTRDSEPAVSNTVTQTDAGKGCNYEDPDSPPRKKSRSSLAMPPSTPRGRRGRKPRARLDKPHRIKKEEADSEPLEVLGPNSISPPQAAVEPPILPKTEHEENLEHDNVLVTTTPDYDYWQEPAPRWDLVPPRPVHTCTETLCGPESKYCEHSLSLGPGPFSDKKRELMNAEKTVKRLQEESAKSSTKRISKAYSDWRYYMMLRRSGAV
ncbi:hypothetical protein CYLTODRAFT_445171 [Cylindrobasidium torrendii FP15055 ss-10]|uniref:Uncharacterized protein n=1 Tax=Cylindrobasidium torrendii FP15055 ss-10 TaxID=1314674 RepID=A0A0D7B5F9_9AGAR|nr:hypothetical protein CYLTODRAFT_445171 [Cylindrobasidium torrendii FP15055 ss-10]